MNEPLFTAPFSGWEQFYTTYFSELGKRPNQIGEDRRVVGAPNAPFL